jgi:hypothetical protein
MIGDEERGRGRNGCRAEEPEKDAANRKDARRSG